MRMIDARGIEKVFMRLSRANPEPKTELESVNDFTLLVAVVLSAQMTDKGVNRATGPLFALVDNPQAMVDLGEEGLKTFISSVNLYPTKARHIIALSAMLLERYGGKIPSTRKELEGLPGVGPKTASVILNVVFGQATVPVDTHLWRIAPRIGLSVADSVRAMEEDLISKIPARYIHSAHHWLLLHGRYVCTARKPLCDSCCINDVCPRNGLS
ncbi:MAG TPA: endonuclease III [Treponemataceae bacterium]|nr:endonuclease III [Treponemataceae bacterium]